MLVSGGCVPQRAEHASWRDADIQHLWRQSVLFSTAGPGLWNSLPHERRWLIIQWILPAVVNSVWTVVPRCSVNLIILTAPTSNIRTYLQSKSIMPDLWMVLISICLSPSLSVCTECMVAKRCILEQKLLLTAYRKSYIIPMTIPMYLYGNARMLCKWPEGVFYF